MIRAVQHDGTGLSSMTGALALAALAGTGLLLGLLLVAPAVSPLAAGLPGLALLGWTGLLVARSASALRLIPMHDRDMADGFQVLLTSGILALLGTAMIVPLFVPSRWRRLAGRRDLRRLRRLRPARLRPVRRDPAAAVTGSRARWHRITPCQIPMPC